MFESSTVGGTMPAAEAASHAGVLGDGWFFNFFEQSISKRFYRRLPFCLGLEIRAQAMQGAAVIQACKRIKPWFDRTLRTRTA